MKIELIKKESVRISRWSGGETREYTLYPQGASYADRDFSFRISSATIEALPSEFTRFEGYRRYLAMLDGDLQLNFNGVDRTYKMQDLFSFQSMDTIISYSKGNDFNLMLHHSITEEVVQVTDQPFQTDQPFVCLFALEVGEVKIDNQIFHLNPLDCLVLTNTNKLLIDIQVKEKVIAAFWSIP
ncbi:HutD family protein [Myroides odoratus]|uniref:HutD family protein n=1 Tax=Myroides odoratus TaxID=256 RepID=UPI0039AFF094